MGREDLKIISNRPVVTHEQAAEVLFNCASLLQMAGANEYRIARYRDAAREQTPPRGRNLRRCRRNRRASAVEVDVVLNP